MASSTGSGSPSLDTINNIFGTSLEFPKCFRKPGTASNFELKTGSGHIGFDGAAHTANLNPTAPISSMMNGIAQDNGYRNIFGALTVTGSSLFLGGVTGETSYWKLNTGSYTITSGGGATITAGGAIKLTADGNLALNASTVLVTSSTMRGAGTVMSGFNISACSGKKDFDIPHPTKTGWRLRHVCIEGPTADVYVRGTLEHSNIIELPEYWVGLVDLETITVSLTPIGYHQELFVERIESGKRVIIKNNSGEMVNCNYLICGERKDVEKNIPEYEGSYDDYPGDNSQYSGSLFKLLRER